MQAKDVKHLSPNSLVYGIRADLQEKLGRTFEHIAPPKMLKNGTSPARDVGNEKQILHDGKRNALVNEK